MKVRVFPNRPGMAYGNIMFDRKYPMRAGIFPKDHPVGGGFCDSGDGQCGNGENIKSFRARGYWASCFPEGDGITWRQLNEQSDEQCLTDIRESFGWDADWDKSLRLTPNPRSRSQEQEREE